MTMLYSMYAREGIIFAADSRITAHGSGERLPAQQKVVRVRRVGVSSGLIGFYGLAQARGQPMSAWLAALIGNWSGSRDPVEFAELVVERLNRETWARERKQVSGFHFGAFQKAASRVEPVFFHIVNTEGFDNTSGLHTDPSDSWRSEEQLMGRDVKNMGLPPEKIRWYLHQVQRLRGIPYWYRNGDMPVFGPVTTFLEEAASRIVRVKGYRPPTNIDGWERIARVFVVTTSQLARAYYAGLAPTIGDRARAWSVEWPRATT
jgi:hypothetical protein